LAEAFCVLSLVSVGTVRALFNVRTNHFGRFGARPLLKISFIAALRRCKVRPLPTPARPCAGITLYSPLKHRHAGPGKRVAIVGLGGLGHMGVKLAHALGAEVTVLSQTSG
jgi:hypothetical protein